MLNRAGLFSALMLIGLLSMATVENSYGQKVIYLSAGFGIPEVLNIGIKGQLKQLVSNPSDSVQTALYYFRLCHCSNHERDHPKLP